MAGSINKPKKPKSKRTPVRLRHKIEKRSAAKQRKARKLSKKNPEWRSKLKKDPGIPNLFPCKERILQEVDEKRMRKKEEAQRRKELARATAAGAIEGQEDAMDSGSADGVEGGAVADGDLSNDSGLDDSNPMAALLASARAAAEEYDRELQTDDEMDEDDVDGDFGTDGGDYDMDAPVAQSTSRKAYDKVFKQVIDQADVVLYVLDARDPEGTRSREVEREVLAAAGGDKRLILVLNKIDLVPPSVLKDWLSYLRRYFPTLPLRASTPAANAQTFDHRELTVQKTSATLFEALKSFAASRQLKRAISVGVIGYPNVGKSSVINALLARLSGRRGAKTAKACPAGAEAGVTTSIRAVKIDSKLTLLDSPGIVFPASSSTPSSGGLVSLKNATEAHAHLVLLNAVPPKQIDDPVPAITLLLRRLSASPSLLQKLTDVYDLPPLMSDRTDGDVTADFLLQVARKRGRLGRGGVPNINAAAMTVVTDWRDGRIQRWVEAPPLIVNAGEGLSAPVGEGAPAPDQKRIVTEWAREFKIEGLWGDGPSEETITEGDGMQE